MLPMRGPRVLVLGDLGLDGDPTTCPGAALEGAQQDGLTDAAQAGDQHRLLGVAAPQPLEQDLEALQLRVAANQGRRRGAGVRGVRVRPRVHDPNFTGFFRIG